MDAFIGEIRQFAGNFAPAGWNLCDGTLLSIAENDALYTLLGTSFGGDGQVTFGLPDLRGRVPLGAGTGTDTIPYAVGQVGGATDVTLMTAHLPVHNHTVYTTTLVGTADLPTNNVLAVAPADCNLYFPSAAVTALNAGHVGPSDGGSQPHSNMQQYQTLNYIIATAGVYPSQS